MTSHRTNLPDEATLDQQWDDFLTGDAPPDLESTVAALRPGTLGRAPSRMFVGQLRDLIATAAGERVHDEHAEKAARRIANPQRSLPLAPERVRPVGGRVRGLSGAARIASILLAASLLIAMVAAVALYPFRDSTGTGGPTVVASGPAIPDVPMPGADPARTGVQPGPNLTTLPEIKQRADIVGMGMALADNVLVVVTESTVRAFDANSLTELWSTKADSGGYSAPAIANGGIYFGFTKDIESGRDDPDNDQLIAMSLADGRELWRVTSAGVYPASPIVLDGIVYALGGTGQQYNVGAYRATDGQQLWRTDVAARGYCCPDTGIALADARLAVSLTDGITPSLKKDDEPDTTSYLVGTTNPHTVGVFDATNGSRLWLDSEPSGGTVGDPVIVGDLLIINEANEVWTGPPDGRLQVNGGASVAYDLATGAVRWTNEDVRSHSLPVTSFPGSKAVLYTGPWADSDGGQMALLSLNEGKSLWSIALPQVPGDTNVYAPSDVPPIVVGDTAYIVGSTQMSGGGEVQSSLLSAVDLHSGETQWMAQIDGGIVSEPLVSGGHIYVLTHDAGLYVLGDGTTPSATPVATPGAVVDLRTPVVCTAAPSDSPMLGNLPATPTIPQVAPWKQPIPFTSIPSGVASDVDAVTAAQLETLFNAYRACSAVDPYHGVFGFFSTDFYVRLKSVQEYWGEPDQPWAVWMASMQEFLRLDTNSLQRLPDGRIGGLINSPSTNIYDWFVQENGIWKIDEYHRIWPDRPSPATSPVPSTSPEGIPQTNPGSGWPFGAGGGGDFTIPVGPDPLRIWLARVQLQSYAFVTMQPNAVKAVVISQGNAAITDPGQVGAWLPLPTGSSAQLASDAPTTLTNRGEEPVTVMVLVMGTQEPFTDATSGAETSILVDVAIDSLPAGAARLHYESLKAAPNAAAIVDTSRGGAALLIVDDGTFAVTRDEGTWQFGSVGSPTLDEPTPDGTFPSTGQVDLNAGSWALITSGAAFHGLATGGREATYFLLTIEINSAVVQEAQSQAAASTASPPGGTDSP